MMSTHKDNHCCGCVSNIALHHAHMELNNGIVNLPLSFTNSPNCQIKYFWSQRYDLLCQKSIDNM